MKKLSKILCAVLVLAMLTSSLVFLVGAEDGSTITSTPTTDAAEIYSALRFDADDNQFKSVLLSTNHEGGWGSEGARKSEILTDSATGTTVYRESANGTITATNEFLVIQLNAFKAKYEEGKNEYIVIDFDYSVEGEMDDLYFQTIPRSGTGYWPDESFRAKNIPCQSGQTVHITYVVDYTNNQAHVFSDGILIATVNNGAIRQTTENVGGHTKYLNGELELTTQEFKIGSNSTSTFLLDNVYIRTFDVAADTDTLKEAVSKGTIDKWDGNIYEGFIPTMTTTDLGVVGNLTSDVLEVVKSDVEGNLITGISRSNLGVEGVLPGHGTYFNTYLVSANRENYYMFVANQDYAPGYSAGNKNNDKNGDGAADNDNNPFISSAITPTNISIAEGSKAMYVVEVDISTSSDYFASAGMEFELRNGENGTGGGFPFGQSFKFSNFTSPGNEWARFTIVGDIATNTLSIFVNGEYKGSAGYAYNKSQVSSGVEILCAKSSRLFIATNADVIDVKKGQSLAFDNIAHRIFVDGDESLSAALAAKDITQWSGYDAGRGGEKLPVVAIMNGVEYCSTAPMLVDIAALGNEKCTIEFKQQLLAPIAIKANATIKTNGMDIDSLVVFDEVCSDPVVDGDTYTVTIPWTDNYTSVHTSNMGQLYTAVKLNHKDNIFSSISPVNYNGENHRWTYLVTNNDTGDVYVNDKPGEKGTINGASNTYLQLKPASNIDYVKGQGQVIILDMDAAIYDRETGSFNPISRYTGGGGAWGNSQANVSDIFEDVALGEFVHLTLMVFTDSRIGYYFVNNELVLTLENALTDGAAYFQDYRMFGNQLINFNYDNVCLRHLKRTELEAIAKAGDLSVWDEAIYNENYVLPSTPALATVDGVGYTSLDTLNEALLAETEEAKKVSICHTFEGTLTIRDSAVVDTHGLDIDIDWDTGMYEFDPESEIYCNENGLAFASSKLIHSVQGTVHTFETIDASNCMTSASVVTWYYDEEFSDFDVVFYVYGDDITPLANDAYIEDGVFFKDAWKEITLDDEGEIVIGEIVDEFPIAGDKVADKLYVYDLVTEEVDFVAEDILIGANVGSNISITVYVNKFQTLSTGEMKVINGVEYVAFTVDVAPHEIDEILEIEFIVADADGNEYIQRQSISFVEYAKGVFESAETLDIDKNILANLLVYANKAHALFDEENATIESVDALLESYAEYIVSTDLAEKLDTEALSSVIRSAALKLNATPEFVFKVARGFKGTIEFSYTGLRGEVKVAKTVDATAGEQLVILNGFDIADVAEDITISVTFDGAASASIVGKYNLATYAQGLENNEFAVALINYAKIARKSREEVFTVSVSTPTIDEDGNETVVTEIVGEYRGGDKIDIPFLRDGITITWYCGDKVWDFENDVITEDVVLTYTEVINKTTLDIVSSETLKLINESKIKQFDGCDVSVTDEDKAKYGYFDKEGGVANYVTAIKEGKPVEALYFSRSVEWNSSVTDTNANWAEHRYMLDPTRKLVSFSFDYLILGTVGKHQASSGESFGEGIFQIKYTEESKVEVGASDPYKNIVYGNETYLEDGNWNTFTYTASTPVELECILIKLYHFMGEMLIANIEVEYAPLDTFNADGTLNTTIVLKDNLSASSYTLTTVVEGKIKQMDQATLDDGTNSNNNGWFTKEGGTAVYVKAVKDGEYVEGIYFSRSKDWTTYSDKSQNSNFSEHRYALDTTKIVESVSFDYIINGTCEAVNHGEGVFQVKDTSGAYHDVVTGEDTYLEDGEWHTFTWENADALALENILIKLSLFQGEIVISNLVITYAE